jgi:hypothetical protein
MCWYSRITSTRSPSFCMTTFSASFTNLEILLPQSHDCSHDASRRIPALTAPWLQKHSDLRHTRHLQLHDCRNTLIYAHTTSRTVPTCDISLSSLKLPLHEAGDFVKLRVLYFSFTAAAWVADRVSGRPREWQTVYNRIFRVRRIIFACNLISSRKPLWAPAFWKRFYSTIIYLSYRFQITDQITNWEIHLHSVTTVAPSSASSIVTDTLKFAGVNIWHEIFCLYKFHFKYCSPY